MVMEAMNRYSLELRNPYYNKKKLPIALLHFTAGFLLLDAWYESSLQSYSPWLGIVFLIIAFFEIIYTFFAFRMMHKKPLLNSIVRIVTACAFLLYSIILFAYSQILFGIVMLVIAFAFVMIFFIEKKWARPLVIYFKEDGVLFPGTFKNPFIPWGNFNHIVLKNNILTFDLSSNRIIQLEMSAVPDEVEVSAINAFCTEKVGSRKE